MTTVSSTFTQQSQCEENEKIFNHYLIIIIQRRSPINKSLLFIKLFVKKDESLLFGNSIDIRMLSK